MKNKKTNATSKIGLLFVESLINRFNDTFQKIDQENDFGFDGILEFFEEEESLNYTTACQIKTGESYFRNGKIYIVSDEEHFKYWQEHNLYSYLFVYNDKQEKCYWLDLSKYVNESQDRYIIDSPEFRELNSDTYLQFKEYVLENKNNLINESKFLKAVEKLLIIKEEYDRTIFKTLQNNRDRVLLWNVLFSKVLDSENQDLLLDILYLFRLATHNPDIFWHKENIIKNENVIKYIKELINGPNKIAFVNKLANLAAEDYIEFQRGSFGQIIFHILDEVENKDNILIDIIKNKNVKLETRKTSFIILMYYKSDEYIKNNLYLLDLLLNDSCIDQNEYKMFKECLQKYGCFQF